MSLAVGNKIYFWNKNSSSGGFAVCYGLWYRYLNKGRVVWCVAHIHCWPTILLYTVYSLYPVKCTKALSQLTTVPVDWRSHLYYILCVSRAGYGWQVLQSPPGARGCPPKLWDRAPASPRLACTSSIARLSLLLIPSLLHSLSYTSITLNTHCCRWLLASWLMPLLDTYTLLIDLSRIVELLYITRIIIMLHVLTRRSMTSIILNASVIVCSFFKELSSTVQYTADNIMYLRTFTFSFEWIIDFCHKY